jgi:hypothetical protein
VRNEVVEELNTALEREHRAKRDSLHIERHRSREMKEEMGSRWEKARSHRAKRANGTTWRSTLARGEETLSQPGASVKLWPNRARWQNLLGHRKVGSSPVQL